MALCVCKCLNVTVLTDRIEENVDISKLDLTPTEQREMFFSEKLLLSPLEAIQTKVVQPALTGQRTLGRWVLYSCFACNQITHATIRDKLNAVLIPKSNQTTIEKINSLKKSDKFSPVFNLIVPELTNKMDMKENVDTNNLSLSEKRSWPPVQPAVGTLSKQLSQTLQSELEAVEEVVRQFKEKKYAEYEAYKEKAQRDHKILASIANKARDNIVMDGYSVGLDNGPQSPQLPPPQRRRLSSIKDAKKISSNNRSNISLQYEEDSLEAEDMFYDLDDNDTAHDYVSEDDYDSDRGSNDEGIHIGRARGGVAAADLARSLPVAVPSCPTSGRSIPKTKELDDENCPQDIAASIKALARSVHGDVYELPRPRFSTQI